MKIVWLGSPQHKCIKGHQEGQEEQTNLIALLPPWSLNVKSSGPCLGHHLFSPHSLPGVIYFSFKHPIHSSIFKCLPLDSISSQRGMMGTYIPTYIQNKISISVLILSPSSYIFSTSPYLLPPFTRYVEQAVESCLSASFP